MTSYLEGGIQKLMPETMYQDMRIYVYAYAGETAVQVIIHLCLFILMQ